MVKKRIPDITGAKSKKMSKSSMKKTVGGRRAGGALRMKAAEGCGSCSLCTPGTSTRSSNYSQIDDSNG